MSEDTQSTFKLNLDSADWLEGAKAAKDAISSIGEASESIEGLMTVLGEAGAVVGVLGAAFFAVKGVMDAVFDAEKIELVQAQFDALSQSAGVYGETLKESLKAAAGGWVDDASLMQAANRSMTELQTGVEKLPELMTLAKQATLVMGGTVVDNFNQISQAVASGNTRLLRHLGIIIDQQKAYRDYAASIGATVGSLSQAGKQQAVLNAILEDTKGKFQGQNQDIQQNINIWNQLKVTLTEIKDVIVLAFDKVAGPTLAKFFTDLKGWAEGAKTWLTANLGSGAEQSAAKIGLMQEKLTGLKKSLQDLEDVQSGKKFSLASYFLDTGKAIDATKAKISQYEQEIAKASAADQKMSAAQKALAEGSSAATKASMVDTAAANKQRAEFDSQALKEKQSNASAIVKLNSDLTKGEITNMTTVAQATRLYHQQQEQQAAQYSAEIVKLEQDKAQKIQKLNADLAAGAITKTQHDQGVALAKQTDDQIVLLNRLKNQAMITDNQKLQQMQEQALANQTQKSTTAFSGISNAFAEMSKKNKDALTDWGKNGQAMTASFSSHFTTAFANIGSGAQSATEAMGTAFAGMVGDMATQYGQMMLLASIFPPDPVGLAAGAALIALGGFLGSLGGSSSSGSSISPSAVSQVNNQAGQNLSNGVNAAGPLQSAAASASTGPKQVNLVIQGHMFGTDATQAWLVQQLRNASDAQDFNISSVGGGF